MRPIPVLVVVTLLFATALAVWFLAPDGERQNRVTRPVTPAEAEADRGSGDVVAAAPLEQEGSGEVARSEPRRELLPTDDGKAPAPRGFAEQPDSGLELFVVEKSTGAPVPGAIVHTLDPGNFTEDEMVKMQAEGFQIDRMFDRYGLKYLADDEGVVRFESLSDNTLLSGKHRDLWGMMEYEEEDGEPYRLVLDVDPSAKIRVVDGAGKPVAGVPVTIRMRNGDWSRDFMRADTNAKGLAEIPHINEILAEMNDAEVYFGLPIVSAEPIEVVVERGRDWDEPYELVLPDTGEVEVSFTLPDGSEPKGAVFAAIRPVRPGEEATSPDAVVRRSSSVETVRLVREGEGTILFAHVGLGLLLEVAAGTLEGQKPVHETVAGPVRAGERVPVSMRFEGTYPILVGRVLDTDERPIVNETLAVRLEGGNTRGRSSTRTDAKGMFRIPLDDEPYDGGTRTLEVSKRMTGGGTGDSAVLDLSYRLSPGDNDVGKLVLQSPPVLVAGTVVGPNGEPVQGARVVLLREERHGREAEHAYWSTLWQFRGRSEGDGSFEIRGRIHDNVELAAQASHEDFITSSRVEFARGSEDVQLGLAAAGRLRIRLVADEDVPLDLFVVTASPETNVDAFASLRGDDELVMRGLVPGPYRVEVALEGDPGTLATVKGVVVTAGETTQDARLEPVDLRGRIRTIKLQTVDEEGAPVTTGEVFRRLPGSEAYVQESTAFAFGEAILHTVHRSLDLRVVAEGYRVWERDGVSRDTEVVLREGPRVRLHLAGGLPELPPDVRLSVVVGFDSGEEAMPLADIVRTRFDEAGEVQVRLTSPGSHWAQIMVHDGRERGSRIREVSDQAPTWFEVRDVQGEQLFPIELAPEALRKALEGKD